ncbi:hypothetical protein Dimus_024332 [Dionaea muscipula]
MSSMFCTTQSNRERHLISLPSSLPPLSQFSSTLSFLFTQPPPPLAMSEERHHHLFHRHKEEDERPVVEETINSSDTTPYGGSYDDEKPAGGYGGGGFGAGGAGGYGGDQAASYDDQPSYTKTDEQRAGGYGDGGYGGGAGGYGGDQAASYDDQPSYTRTDEEPVDYEKEKKHHKHLEEAGGFGAAATGAFGLNRGLTGEARLRWINREDNTKRHQKQDPRTPERIGKEDERNRLTRQEKP